MNNPKLLPDGYADYILCTKIYHCTPNELRQQEKEIVQRDLGFYNAEQKDAEIKRAAAGKK